MLISQESCDSLAPDKRVPSVGHTFKKFLRLLLGVLKTEDTFFSDLLPCDSERVTFPPFKRNKK